MTERGGAINVQAVAVGAAMRERGRHAGEKRALRRHTSSVHESRDSAHDGRASLLDLSQGRIFATLR